MVSILLHLKKATLLTIVNVSGSDISVKLVNSKNALSPIEVTPLSTITFLTLSRIL